MDKGLATPKFLYRKHMGCWLRPRTLGMHWRQLRIDVYMYKYICIQSTKHTSICIDLVFVVALGGPSNVWIHINLGWIWRSGSPFGRPGGRHFGGSLWFGGTLHWVLLLEIRLWEVPPGRVKKQFKHRFSLEIHKQGPYPHSSTYGQAVGPFCSRRSGCTSALLGGPGGTGVGPAVAHIFF